MRAALLTILFATVALAEDGAHAERDMTLWKWANFFILAGVAGYLIKKSAGPFFKARSEEIRQGIEGAQKMKADAEAKAAEIDQRLAAIGVEIEKLKAGGAAEERAETERIRRETDREIARIGTQSEQDIASAVKAAKAELRRHAGQLAVELARQKTADRITADDQNSLIESFASNLKSSN